MLDFGLNHANSAVVMATAKLFLHYTLGFEQQHHQVRCQPPPSAPGCTRGGPAPGARHTAAKSLPRSAVPL